MRAKAFLLVCLLACLSVVSALAQEGHPLKGTWLGDWGPNNTFCNPSGTGGPDSFIQDAFTCNNQQRIACCL